MNAPLGKTAGSWTLALVSDDAALHAAVAAMLHAGTTPADLRLVRPREATASLREHAADIVLIDADTAGDIAALLAVALLVQTAPVCVLGHRLEPVSAKAKSLIEGGASLVWGKVSGTADPLLASQIGGELLARLDAVRSEHRATLLEADAHG